MLEINNALFDTQFILIQCMCMYL